MRTSHRSLSLVSVISEAQEVRARARRAIEAFRQERMRRHAALEMSRRYPTFQSTQDEVTRCSRLY